MREENWCGCDVIFKNSLDIRLLMKNSIIDVLKTKASSLNMRMNWTWLFALFRHNMVVSLEAVNNRLMIFHQLLSLHSTISIHDHVNIKCWFEWKSIQIIDKHYFIPIHETKLLMIFKLIVKKHNKVVMHKCNLQLQLYLLISLDFLCCFNVANKINNWLNWKVQLSE